MDEATKQVLESSRQAVKQSKCIIEENKKVNAIMRAEMEAIRRKINETRNKPQL